jgi:hypothetical protein
MTSIKESNFFLAKDQSAYIESYVLPATKPRPNDEY